MKDSLTLPICLLSFLNVDVFTFGCAGSSLLRSLLSSCGELGLLHSVVCELLVAGASLVAELRLWATQASVLEGCGSVAVPGLWSTDAVVVAHRLRCAAACGVFPYQRSCIPRWLLYHWAPGKPIWPFLTEINIAFPYESVTTHLDLYIIDLKMYAHTKLCAFVATVFCNFLSAPCGM